MGRFFAFLLICLLAVSKASAAFAPKRGEATFKRQQDGPHPTQFPYQQQAHQDAIAAAAAQYCSEESCYPPPFAFAQAAASMSPVHAQPQQEWYSDDDMMVVGYGTGVVACVVSLALGFSMGYLAL